MSARPTRRDLLNAFFYTLRRRSHNEANQAIGRLLLVFALVLLVGVAGSFLIQILPAPAPRLFVREENCAYNAELAGLPATPPIAPGASVNVGWIIRNIETCTWGPTVTLRLWSGDLPVLTDTLTVIDYAMPPATRDTGIATGEAIAPLVPVTAPLSSGVHETIWRLYAPNDRWFGPEFKYTIEIGAAGAVGAPPPRPGIDWWFVVPAIIGVILAVIQAGNFVTRLYSLKDSNHGPAFAAATTFGFPEAAWSATARNGELEGAERIFAPPPKLKPGMSPPPPDPNEPIFKIGGPGTLYIAANTVVVLERGSRYSRMLGPGEYRLREFERVRAVYDLRTQAFSGAELALTKDGIPAEASVNLQFRFMRRIKNEPEPKVPPPGFMTVLRRYRGKVIRPTESDPLPASPEAIRLATYELHALPGVRVRWINAAYSAISSEVRDAMAARYLDQLFAPDDPESHPRADIANRLRDEGKAILARRGVELVSSGFGNITVPKEVTELRRNMWRTLWKKESLITQSGGEAESFLQTQIARAEAQAELIQSITQAIRTMDQTNEGDPLHPLTLRFMDTIARMVDRNLRDSSSDTNSRAEMTKMLERLRKALKTDQT